MALRRRPATQLGLKLFMSSTTHIAARSAPLLGNLYSVAIEAPSFRLSSFSRVTYRNNFAHKFRGFEAQSSSAIAFMGCENPPRGGKRLDIEIFMGTHFLDAARENDRQSKRRRLDGHVPTLRFSETRCFGDSENHHLRWRSKNAAAIHRLSNNFRRRDPARL